MCLGTVKLGNPNYGFQNEDKKESNSSTFLQKIEYMGIKKIDTSPRYGNSEKILGEFIKKSNNKFFISSKIDGLIPQNNNSINVMIDSVNKSLDNLNINYLNVCYLHQNDIEIISDPYIHEGLLELKARKLIKNAGASIYNNKEFDYSINSKAFDYIQIPMNIVDLSFYKSFIRKNSPKRIVARSLLLHGALINRKSFMKRIANGRKLQYKFDLIDQIAKSHKKSVLELSISSIFSLDGIDHCIIGSTSIKNMKNNFKLSKVLIENKILGQLLNTFSSSEYMANPKNWIFND